MAENAAERLTRLEAHVTHLERLCEQLNAVIADQGREVTRLKKQQARIADSVESIELERIKATNAKPPHYQ
jgi:uncharacterized coiled-coil protein SlyX